MRTATLTTEIWFGVDKNWRFFRAFDAHGITVEEVRETLAIGAPLVLHDVTTGKHLEWVVFNIPNRTQIELLFITRS